jgi:hypothetical protein
MSNPVPHKQGRRKPAQSATQLQSFSTIHQTYCALFSLMELSGNLTQLGKGCWTGTPEALDHALGLNWCIQKM